MPRSRWNVNARVLIFETRLFALDRMRHCTNIKKINHNQPKPFSKRAKSDLTVVKTHTHKTEHNKNRKSSIKKLRILLNIQKTTQSILETYKLTNNTNGGVARGFSGLARRCYFRCGCGGAGERVRAPFLKFAAGF